MTTAKLATVSEGILNIVNGGKVVGQIIYSNLFGDSVLRQVSTHDELAVLDKFEDSGDNLIIQDILIHDAQNSSEIFSESIELIVEEFVIPNGYKSIIYLINPLAVETLERRGFKHVTDLTSANLSLMRLSIE